MISMESAAWYSSLVELHEKVSEGSFFADLSDTLKEIVGFDCSGVMFYNGREVHSIYKGDFSVNFDKHIALYLKGLYLLDPHYNMLASGVDTGLYCFRDILPDHYRETEYYNTFIKPVGITDEYDFIVKIDNCYVDFYMDKLEGKFSPAEEAKLVALMPMVTYLIKTHWDNYDYGLGVQKLATSAKPYQSIFDSFGKSILTDREQDVIQCILNGHSSKSLAQKLNISLSTVKIHRKHIYQKLDIKSQSELFSLCIQSLAIQELNESDDPLGALMAKQ